MTNKLENALNNNFLNAELDHEKNKQKEIFFTEFLKLEKNLREENLARFFNQEEESEVLQKMSFVKDSLREIKKKMEENSDFSARIVPQNLFYDKVINSLEVLSMAFRRLNLKVVRPEKDEKDLFEEEYLKKLIKEKIVDLGDYLEKISEEKKLEKELELPWEDKKNV